MLRKGKHTYGIRSEIVSGQGPSIGNLPCRFGHICREGKPVVVLVLLEIGKGDEEETVDKRRVAGRDDVIPGLLSMGVEQRSLIRRFEVFDGVIVLEATLYSDTARARLCVFIE